jgi:hypothetical protein
MKKITKTRPKDARPGDQAHAPAPARKSTAAPKIKKPATAAAAPAVVAKPKGSRVTIVAKVDVGFGNTLFVRGTARA